MAQITCPHCGKSTDDGFPFCTQCGGSLQGAQATCSQCGAPLEPDQKFCSSCGAPQQTPAAEPGASPQPPIDQTTPMSSDYASPAGGPPPMGSIRDEVYNANKVGDTASMPPVEAPDPVRYAPAPAPQKSNTGKIVLIIVICVAVLAIIAAVVIGIFFSDQKTPIDTFYENEQVESSSSSNGASSSSSSATDLALYHELLDAYDEAGEYDSEIASAARSYNANITNTSRSTREGYYHDCQELTQDIQDEQRDLSNLNVSSSSPYYQDYKNIDQLYNDLYNRISVITESWRISLNYDVPANHMDAINGPIIPDNDANGINIYKKDFDSLYPSARPTQK